MGPPTSITRTKRKRHNKMGKGSMNGMLTLTHYLKKRGGERRTGRHYLVYSITTRQLSRLLMLTMDALEKRVHSEGGRKKKENGNYLLHSGGGIPKLVKKGKQTPFFLIKEKEQSELDRQTHSLLLSFLEITNRRCFFLFFSSSSLLFNTRLS
eukprot:TRINITY_DN3229_c0_g2_i1.p1 TRINITY_DN3229_c0_g2~~TRINITY_DN3229_c0_g2_i1.p1  ORF type:complete len:153 (-),score=12.02 TRINITY_DN3229_c0_g2_i1:104-562(-)